MDCFLYIMEEIHFNRACGKCYLIVLEMFSLGACLLLSRSEELIVPSNVVDSQGKVVWCRGEAVA